VDNEDAVGRGTSTREEVHKGRGMQGVVEEGADVVQEESRQGEEDRPSQEARGIEGK